MVFGFLNHYQVLVGNHQQVALPNWEPNWRPKASQDMALHALPPRQWYWRSNVMDDKAFLLPLNHIIFQRLYLYINLYGILKTFLLLHKPIKHTVYIVKYNVWTYVFFQVGDWSWMVPNLIPILRSRRMPCIATRINRRQIQGMKIPQKWLMVKDEAMGSDLGLLILVSYLRKVIKIWMRQDPKARKI